MMRHKAPHSMLKGAPSPHPPKGSPRPTMPPSRHEALSKESPDLHKPRGRTSRLESPASDPRQTRSACNGVKHHQPCRSSRARKRQCQTTDAIDTKALECQFRGCSQALLYNTRRPHMALEHRTPMAVWRAGITGCLDGKAVDMTLRLDNAGALPTCPQPQQPQMMIA